ncbi:MAG: phosphocholine cytidylyltransferase family protein [Chloroflexi bacterium]|nr:phosphocholine cytidylyltransferase family protein [Chloroflexota bacterium]
MKALIVAAGKSSRLYPLTNDTPKPLLQIGGRSIIERSVDLLNANGISEVIVVVGFHHEKMREALHERASFVFNPFYELSNNMASLWLALPYLEGDAFVYLHADVIYHEALISELVSGAECKSVGADVSVRPGRGGAPRPFCTRNDFASETTDAGIRLLVDPDRIDEEAMKVRVADGRFVESSKAIPSAEAAGEWTGLARISPNVIVPLRSAIETILAQGFLQSYDTAAFSRLAQEGVPFGLMSTNGLPWYEIDTMDDLEHAASLFGGRSH